MATPRPDGVAVAHLAASKACGRSTATSDIGRLPKRTSSPRHGEAFVRRRFYDRAIAEASPIFPEALQHIAQLSGTKWDIGVRDPQERRTARQERSLPINPELDPAAHKRRAHQHDEQTH